LPSSPLVAFWPWPWCGVGRRRGLGASAYVAAVVLYVLIALVAVVPGMVAEIGVVARPLRVEALLQTILVFLGVNFVWLLLFDEAPSPSALEDPTRPRA
jgi:hypothetical protein